MSTLQSRKSTYAKSSMREIELSHLEAQAYHILYRCSQKCYLPEESSYYQDSKDL